MRCCNYIVTLLLTHNYHAGFRMLNGLFPCVQSVSSPRQKSFDITCRVLIVKVIADDYEKDDDDSLLELARSVVGILVAARGLVNHYWLWGGQVTYLGH